MKRPPGKLIHSSVESGLSATSIDNARSRVEMDTTNVTERGSPERQRLIHMGSGPSLTTTTPRDIKALPIQAGGAGPSPMTGMAISAVIAGHSAAKLAALEAPRMLTAPP